MTRLALVAGAALALVTVAIPLQLDHQWVTIGWALEGAALAWLYQRVPHRGLLLAATALLVVVFVRLALNPSIWTYEPRGALRIFNWYLYTYAIAAVAMFAAAWFLTRTDDRAGVVAAASSRLLPALATVLLFLLLNIEIADYYATGPAITFRFGVRVSQDLTYTIGWLAFGMMLLGAGIYLHNRPARIAAVGLIAVTAFKCFLYDLASLGGLYRVASFVGLAIALALVSLVLQKYVLAKPGGTSSRSGGRGGGRNGRARGSGFVPLPDVLMLARHRLQRVHLRPGRSRRRRRRPSAAAWRATGPGGFRYQRPLAPGDPGLVDGAARRGGARAFTGAIAQLRRRPRRGRQQRADSVPPRTARRATVAGPRAAAGHAADARAAESSRQSFVSTRSRCRSRIFPVPSSRCRPPERSSGVSCSSASNARPTAAGARPAFEPLDAGSLWQHGDATIAPPPLELALPFERSRELLLIVDEGDNKPLPITGVRLLLPGWQLRFHRPPAR